VAGTDQTQPGQSFRRPSPSNDGLPLQPEPLPSLATISESTDRTLSLSGPPVTGISGLYASSLQLTDGVRSAPMADLGHLYLPSQAGNTLHTPAATSFTVPTPAQPAPTRAGTQNQMPTLIGQPFS